MLEVEYRYYKAHAEELVRQYDGKYLGIVGEQVVGIFDTEVEAYTELKKKYGLGKFLLQQAVPIQDNLIQRYHSRVA